MKFPWFIPELLCVDVILAFLWAKSDLVDIKVTWIFRRIFVSVKWLRTVNFFPSILGLVLTNRKKNYDWCSFLVEFRCLLLVFISLRKSVIISVKWSLERDHLDWLKYVLHDDRKKMQCYFFWTILVFSCHNLL